MQTDQRAELKRVRTFPSLIRYLRDEMGWPIESDDFEDITFEYTPEELGIDAKNAAKISEIKRLRPLSANQPWGIFFVKFEPKRLPVVVLRRILSQVVLKKRASANRAERTAWAADDLLFISNYGEGDARQISFAHFSEAEGKHDLPTLKVLGWDNLDTPLHLDDVAERLTQQLAWPDDDRDIGAWRTTWRGAFNLRPREVISTARELSIRLAELARAIRNRARTALAYETKNGPLTKLMKAFQETLVHDLDADGFADMYAQTIAYGLLSARVENPKAETADDLPVQMPVTNPFLKELMETFLHIGGRRGRSTGPGIDFDELGVREVVELLDDAKMEAVVRDFGDRNPQEDPVIHFYELFLKEYDAKKRMQRGVFYTPRPVVSYIVRSVDDVLRTEFGLEDGLADTTTWAEMAKLHPDINIPDGVDPHEPFVQILDPAAGTGTFLVEVIDLIYHRLVDKWTAQGTRGDQLNELWNDYVAEHLLPRLYGYELMMAPYAVAHLKIGLKLHETGYQFATNDRAQVYLTNSLEPYRPFQASFDIPALAHEAQAVNDVKLHRRFTVVIGNPPYSASITEPDWLMRSLDDWKRGLNETKMDLNREEWKFLRFGQVLCDRVPSAVLGYIINRDFLDGIAKRVMRDNLRTTFPFRTIIDLNGDVKGNVPDENVFEITQGVAIVILAKSSRLEHRYRSVVGSRQDKYQLLIEKQSLNRTLVKFEVLPPYFRWVPFLGLHQSIESEYALWPSINTMFQVYSSGIQTKRDSLTVHFTADEVWSTVQRFRELSADEARREFSLGPDGRDWTVAGAKADISASGPDKSHIVRLLYRPFDYRYTYWTGRTKGFLAYPRREVMQHVIGHDNVGIIFNRQIVGDSISHFGASRAPICHGTFYLGNKGQDYFAPLQLFRSMDVGSVGTSTPSTNFDPQFLQRVAATLGERPTSDEIFHYVYAVVHSPTYRSRYQELLKADFPRLPITANRDLFRGITNIGSQLVALHLMDSPRLTNLVTTYTGPKSPVVKRVTWTGESVWLDAPTAKVGQETPRGSAGFHGVPKSIWMFRVGGYQVCEKWLKDRVGRTLSREDISHYQRVIVALAETLQLMDAVDGLIDAHGGWPGAFGSSLSL